VVDSESESLDSYFENKKYVQEQFNSSELDLSFPTNTQGLSWSELAFADRCEWFELERIVDGDTIIVINNDERIRVRMIGIDTPESKKAGTPIEAYSLAATDALEELLEEKNTLCLVEDRVGDKYDTYGRKLSYVFTETGRDINDLMIETGWAEAYTRFPMERADEFEALEAVARQTNLGRWE